MNKNNSKANSFQVIIFVINDGKFKILPENI
jgi:hypothetical protein